MKGRELFDIKKLYKVKTPFCLVFASKVYESSTCFFAVITSVRKGENALYFYGHFLMRYDARSCDKPLIYRSESKLAQIAVNDVDNLWALCKPTKNDYNRILNELIARIYDVDADLQRRIIKFVKHFKCI